MTALCSKKDIKIFMKIGSYGVVFVIILMCFIIYTGIHALINTDFSIGSYEDSMNTDWNSSDRKIVLFYHKFPWLLGSLCSGFFLHTMSL